MSLNQFNKSLDSKNPLAACYAPDDYEHVNATYFSEILRNKSWKALPAGWLNPHSVAADQFVMQPSKIDDSIRYALDEDYSLGDQKAAILQILSTWENNDVSWNEVTICPSVSTANLVVLAALKARGIDTVIFETPAYYATLMQATMLGFCVKKIPCLPDNDFEISIDDLKSLCTLSPFAVWMTQPRFGIGKNQCREHVRNIAEIMRPSDVLIFDEASEQLYPSVLSNLEIIGCNVIRTRSLLKGLGLNGLRTAVILHPSEWRAEMEIQLEPSGASLDRFSLRNVASLAENSMLLPALLATANSQATGFRKELDLMTLGTWIKPTTLVNGYMGSLILDFNKLPGNYLQKREALLNYCKSQKMPVVLRASIGFPYDESWEAIRINYFTSRENVMTSAQILIDGYLGLQKYLP
mgnify:CR=1|jgi:histidinol-phosphate/aromatic aminotransferase/cobyric acid decarboxylase-like protein